MPDLTPAEVIREALLAHPGKGIDAAVASVLDALKTAGYTAVETDCLRGELTATKMLLEVTQELHAKTIADFCALRDVLPREQVKQILGVDDA